MADKTKIEWTDATWNPITGCSVVSPGCTNCYAMKLAGTRLKNHESRKGLTRDTKAGPVWTGEVRFNEQWLDQPLRWSKPRMIFVCAHADLFAEGVQDEWIDKIFAVMALSPHHTFQVLTKRPERMHDYMAKRFGEEASYTDLQYAAQFRVWTAMPKVEPLAIGKSYPAWPLPNVWLGVSVEDQKRAEERIPLLLKTPAAVRWISAEPLLGPIDLKNIDIDNDSSMDTVNARLWRDEWELSWKGTSENAVEELESFLDWYGISSLPDGFMHPTLDWVVAGGESGYGARPMQQAWARTLRDQCTEAHVPFHFKQWGAYTPTSDCNGSYMMHVGKRAAGRLLDGVTHDAFPFMESK